MANVRWIAISCLALAGAAHGQSITEFALPTQDSEPQGITAGSDGNVWFTELQGRIGRITPAGVITEFSPPTTSAPFGITAGGDGNLWFAEAAGGIGRITTAGVVTEFSLPVPGSNPQGIVSGPDGALWFTEYANRIGRITTAGAVTEFPIPAPNSNPKGIVAGPDGNLWFAEYAARQIGRITTDGEITEFSISTPGGGPLAIASGSDGALWFTEPDANKIGRVTTAGEITEFPIPTANSHPVDIASAPDGSLWFTASLGKVSRITTTGVVTELSVPGGVFSAVYAIAFGPAGNPWFTERGLGPSGNKIGRVNLGSCGASPTTLCLGGGRFRLSADWSIPSRGESGHGIAVPLTGDSGYFWFFDAGSAELVAKLLNGCEENGRRWVFAGGLTNVEVTFAVQDAETGALKVYTNPSGTAFSPIQDTAAFPCP